ncbi:ABC transporter substrate-binding protein [Microvirga sp. W0021]|uniref:ABC transporter substrate-binding protein n=1 Tax=Hohaiivirga grylli TaxID=3133970 RepID=A0ABV0BKU2_9HYPH
MLLRTFIPKAFTAICILFASGIPTKAETEKEGIISLGAGVTEILYSLDLGKNIVAVDTTSVYPKEALATKKNVGYVRTLSAEGILSLEPKIILADAIAGPADAISLIQQAGVKFVRVPEGLNPEKDIRDRIETIAKATDEQDKGSALVKEVEANLAKVTEEKKKHPLGKRVLFILSASNGRIMIGGKDTNIDHILSFIGARNVGASVTGWKPISEEGIIAAAPEVILVMSKGHGPGSIPDDLFALPAFASTPAAKSKALITVDAPYLMSYGPRTPVAALALLKLIHSENTGPQELKQ